MEIYGKVILIRSWGITYMNDQKVPLPNNINIIPQGESIIIHDKTKEFIMSDEFKNYSANRINDNMTSLVKIPNYPNLLKTKAEQDKHLTDRMDNTNKLLEDSNRKISELQLSLEESYTQLQEANNKIESQTSVIEKLRMDLEIASLKSEIAEGKLSGKDWKSAFIALLTGVVILGVEHWNAIYNFILSLFL